MHWLWLIPAFVVGTFVGFFVSAWLRWSEGWNGEEDW